MPAQQRAEQAARQGVGAGLSEPQRFDGQHGDEQHVERRQLEAAHAQDEAVVVQGQGGEREQPQQVQVGCPVVASEDLGRQLFEQVGQVPLAGMGCDLRRAAGQFEQPPQPGLGAPDAGHDLFALFQQHVLHQRGLGLVRNLAQGLDFLAP
ncbi:hypothetical protein G6F57_021018 [Rhizopus arrhizus]|nr:hypothetical protein G6F57_021018 [Rhizopus arrhizus]